MSDWCVRKVTLKGQLSLHREGMDEAAAQAVATTANAKLDTAHARGQRLEDAGYYVSIT